MSASATVATLNCAAHFCAITTLSASIFLTSSAVICLAAQYLLCRKKIENWWLWITADVIYVPLYASKNLPLTSALYAGFIVLCILGITRWKKELHR